MKKPSESKPKGNCYFAAGQFALNDLTGKKFDFIGTPYVVHAEVLGKGELRGIRFGHAWVEDDEFVYDYSNNREIKFPKVLYYLIGNIKTNNPKKYRKYTFKQAREKMLKTGNYGCWDIDVEFKRGGMLESADLKSLKDKYENLDFDFGTTQEDDTATTLKAPNGKPSKLTPEQYKLVRTPEFKAWFGDWENDPANASKVVDENGEPLVVYRGDSSASKKGFIFKTGFNRMGFINKDRLPNQYFHYFVDQYDVALGYAQNQVEEHNDEVKLSGKGKIWDTKVTPYFLNIRNIIDITPNNPLFPSFEEYYKDYKESSRESWYEENKGLIPLFYGYFISNKYYHKILNEKLNDYLDDKSSDFRYHYLSDMDKENLKNSNYYNKTWTYFAEYKNDRLKSNALYRTYRKMLENKVDGIVFLESTHFIDKNYDGRREKYSSGELEYDYRNWVNKPKVFATLQSNQIKLADGSNTTFDSSNPDIRYDDGGQVDYSDYKTSVVALFNEDNEVLILQRGKTAPWMPNKWSLVGGVVDAGESPIESAIREIKEEIGITIDYIDYVTHKTSKDSGELFFFTGNLPKGEIIKLDYENQDYAFVNESNYEVFDFVPDVKEFLMGLFNLNTDVKYNDGGEVENKLDAIKEKFLMPISWHSYISGYGTYKGVRLRIKDHIANWDNFYNYDLSWLENGENPYLLSIAINDEWNGGVWYKNYEQSDINVDNFIANYQDEYPNLKAKELVFSSDSSIENIISEIEYEVEKMNRVDSYKKGGQINIEDYLLLIYHEKEGNWAVSKNEIYLWLYDDNDAGKKLQSGEYNYVFFPPTPPLRMAFKKNFVPPLLQVWTKKYQAEHKGSDKLMAIVRAWYDETNHKLYILMMTTRKDLRRKGIISAMVKNLRNKLNVKQEDVIFDDPTEEGKMVLESKKYDVGGNVI